VAEAPSDAPEPATADARLFADAVSVDGPQRLAVLAGAADAGALAEAEQVLRLLAEIDERRDERRDDGPGHEHAALRRVEAKLDLALLLLGRAMPGASSLAAVTVRLSARGCRVPRAACATVPAAAAGVHLRWRPSEALGVEIALPLVALAQDEAQAWWAFAPLGEPLHDLLERHVFRLHRRWLAQQRQG
jgi:hypothetical protein